MLELLPEQRLAVDRLRSGSVLCGGTGTGKSVTALAYFVEKVVEGGYSPFAPPRHPVPLYIITTAKKRDSLEWEKELARFGMTTEPGKGLDVVVTSWNKVKELADVKDSFFIFDEQRVVGNGAWVTSFLKIASSNRWILLSATPGDVWMDYVPVFIANGYFKNRTEFCNKHVVYNRFTKYPSVSRYLGVRHLEWLRAQVLVSMDVERHTERRYHDVIVEYDVDAYEAVRETRFDPVVVEPIQDAGGLCRALRRLSDGGPDRYKKTLEICRRAERSIVFYNFDYELERLRGMREDLAGEGFVVAECNGHKHDPLPGGERWVYLVQYAAGAEGWNCTTCDTVVFYSPTYSYRQQAQAEGRIDRINTPFKVLHYYRLRTRSGIDAAILKALREKRTFNERGFAKTVGGVGGAPTTC